MLRVQISRDVGTGKKANELRSEPNAGSKRDATCFLPTSSAMIHSMSYSAIGTALATDGDDCVVRIWDARGLGGMPEYAEGLGPVPVGPKDRPGTKEPTNTFPTRRTSILDLQYTKRNLLLACGNHSSPSRLSDWGLSRRLGAPRRENVACLIKMKLSYVPTSTLFFQSRSNGLLMIDKCRILHGPRLAVGFVLSPVQLLTRW